MNPIYITALYKISVSPAYNNGGGGKMTWTSGEGASGCCGGLGACPGTIKKIASKWYIMKCVLT